MVYHLLLHIKVLSELPSLLILNGKKRSSYDISEKQLVIAGPTSDEHQGHSHTNTHTAITADTDMMKSTSKASKRVKVQGRSYDNDMPTKKLKQRDRVEDMESERYSIAVISGEAPVSKAKNQKAKSLSGVISVSKPKVRRRSKEDVDISKLNCNTTFGTGQTTQWF